VKRILLILAPSRISSRCVDAAVAAADGKKGELIVVFILDTSISEEVRERLRNLGLLGKAPSAQILDAMRQEQERQGRSELARIAELARGRGVACRTVFTEGEFLGRSLEIAKSESAHEIFVVRRSRPTLSRLLAGSAVEDLASSVPCDVKIHDEGRSD